MTDVLKPDLCILGAGSGGLSVAAGAAAFGVSVVLVEKHKMGGDCLNTGCVPSKALLAAGKRAKFQPLPFSEAYEHVQATIKAIEPHDSVERFESLGVRVIQAHGQFVDQNTVKAGDLEIRARRYVIATGSHPFVPPIQGLSDVPFLTNETLFELKEAPEHLIILGAGPIGLEMAQAHCRLGSRVTVVEAGDVLQREDPEMVAVLRKALEDEGVEIMTGANVHSLTGQGKGILVDGCVGDSAFQLSGSHFLVATGRRPNVDGLGLGPAGIVFDEKGIKTDKGLRTSNRKVYAIGDVTGGEQFTHAAGYHASLVIKSALFRLPVSIKNLHMPRVTYTSPELGHVGMGVAEARQLHGDKVRVLTADYSGNDRARTEGQTAGQLKLIVGPRGRLLGADIVGANAGEITSLLSLCLSGKMTMKDLAGFIAPYPTYSELVRRAAVSYFMHVPKNRWIRRILAFLRQFG